MNDVLSYTDPAALHAAIDRNLRSDPLALFAADARVLGTSQAGRYAPHNRHLLADPWVARSVSEAARDDDGISGLPADGSAVIVRSNLFSTTEFPGDEWHRSAEPLRSDGEPLSPGYGTCHRCDLSTSLSLSLGLVVEQKPLTVFHISRGRFVVEFATCDKCTHYLNLTYGPIVKVISRGTV